MRDFADFHRAFHARSWKAELVRRTLLWACLSIVLLASWTIVCVLAGLSRDAWLAAFIIVCSILPAFLFWPLDRKVLLHPLRDADPDTLIESYPEAEGAARGLLQRRLADLMPRLSRIKRGPSAFVSGVARPALAALAALVILQIVSIIAYSRPILVWSGPPAAIDSGIRVSSKSGVLPQSQLPQQVRSPDSGMDSGKDSQQARGKEKGNEELVPPEISPEDAGKRLPAPAGGADAPAIDRQNPAPRLGAARPVDASSGGTSEGRPDDKSGAANQGSFPGEARKGITGFEGGGASGVPSPLVDYRARIYRELLARESTDSRASGRLSDLPFSELQRRYFDSFKSGAAIGPREDDWTAQLRRRWASILAAAGKFQ